MRQYFIQERNERQLAEIALRRKRERMKRRESKILKVKTVKYDLGLKTELDELREIHSADVSFL